GEEHYGLSRFGSYARIRQATGYNVARAGDRGRYDRVLLDLGAYLAQPRSLVAAAGFPLIFAALHVLPECGQKAQRMAQNRAQPSTYDILGYPILRHVTDRGGDHRHGVERLTA